MSDTQMTNGFTTPKDHSTATQTAALSAALSAAQLVAGITSAVHFIHRTYVDWDSLGFMPGFGLMLSFMLLVGVYDGTGPTAQHSQVAHTPQQTQLQTLTQKLMTIRLTCAAAIVLLSIATALWHTFT